MNCHFETSGDRKRCKNCRLEITSPHPPEMCYATCPRGAPAPAPRGDCAHRGIELRQENCPSCQGRVRVKIFSCALFGECTLAKQVGELACCASCESRPGVDFTAEALSGVLDGPLTTVKAPY